MNTRLFSIFYLFVHTLLRFLVLFVVKKISFLLLCRYVFWFFLERYFLLIAKWLLYLDTNTTLHLLGTRPKTIGKTGYSHTKLSSKFILHRVPTSHQTNTTNITMASRGVNNRQTPIFTCYSV